MSIGAVMMMAEARRRQRDERGRYMAVGGEGNEMYSPNSGQGGSSNENASMYSGNGGGNNRGNNRGGNGGSSMNGNDGGSMMANYGDGNGSTMNGYSHHPGWLPPYYEGGEMRRQGGSNNAQRRNRRYTGSRNANDGDQPQMGGYGGFVWDKMNPVWPRAGGEDDDDDDDEGDDNRARMMHGGNVTDMQQYRRQHPGEAPRKIGFGEESGKEHLTRKEAEEWVSMMDIPGDKPGEMKRGGKWTFDEIKRYAGNFGITGEQQVIDFYVAVNMMYSDYCKVAKKYGLDKGVEFFAELAKSFLHDTDAVKDKLVAYWENIAKKE